MKIRILKDPKKQSDEEFSNEGDVKTIIKILYVSGLFNRYNNADVVLQDYQPIEVNERCRPDLHKK